MKVIFLKDIKNQGKKDEIKEVKDGYAKFLISSKSAVAYSAKSVEVLNKQIDNRKNLENSEIEVANELKKKLEKLKIEFKVKTGKEDKVFGSVSSKQISEDLKKKGYEIDKKKIKIDNEINSLGTHIVILELHKKVKCEIKINLIK